MADTLVRPSVAVRHGPRTRAVAALAVGGSLLSLAIAAAAAFAGVTQQVQLPDWWGPWPVGRTEASAPYVALEIIALGALCLLWTWTAGQFSRGRWPAARLPAVLALGASWAAPLLFSGPVGSLDVQSYAAIGRMAALGLDPYRAAAGVLDDGFSAAVDPLWRSTPTPYGPLQVQLLHGVEMLSGGSVAVTVLLVRAVTVLGLGVALALALRAATPSDRVPVIVLTALNPVVLVHVVSGAHLDVLIGLLALLVVGLTRRGNHAAAMALAVVACAVKLPGSVLMAFVMLDVIRRLPRSERTAALLRTSGAGVAAVLAVVLLCPDPFGWVRALSVPGIVRNGVAPSTWVSYLLALVTGHLGPDHLTGPGLDAAFTVGRTATGAIGVCLVVALLLRATSGTTRQAYHGVGWALVALALTGPALYPWYLTWGLFAAALASGPRGRTVLVGLSTITCVAGALGQGWVVFGTWVAVLLAVVAAALGPSLPGTTVGVFAGRLGNFPYGRFTGRVQEDLT